MKIRVKFEPKGKVVTVTKGENLLQAGLKNRIYIKNRCGGKGSCSACKVQILSENSLVSLPSPQELRMLKEEDIAQRYRLACQTRAYGPVEVLIIEDTWKLKVREQLEGSKQEEGKKE